MDGPCDLRLSGAILADGRYVAIDMVAGRIGALRPANEPRPAAATV